MIKLRHNSYWVKIELRQRRLNYDKVKTEKRLSYNKIKTGLIKM